MLESNFREGQMARSALAPQEIELPDDDAVGVSDMCHLLHHKADKITSELSSARRLYHYALAIDKYGCREVLTLQSEALMQRHLESLTDGKKKDWNHAALDAGTAYLLQDSQGFQLATKRLIMDFNNSFLEFRVIEGGELLPVHALLAMEEKRNKGQSELARNAPDVFQSPEGRGFYPCRSLLDQLHRFLGIVWPPHFVGDFTILVALKQMRDLASVLVTCDCGDHIDVSDDQLQGFIARLEKKYRGLCLKCLKEDKEETRLDCHIVEHL